MKKLLLLFALIIYTSILFAQKIKALNIDKWEKAIINIYAVSKEYTGKEAIQVYQTLKPKIDSTKFVDSLKTKGFIISGTAIYLKDGNNRYLITNRHLVIDEKGTEEKREKSVSFEVEKTEKNYLDILWLQTNLPLNAYLKNQKSFGSLSYMGVKNIDEVANISDDSLDIAILSLQNISGKLFLSGLKDSIYEPISITDIDTTDLFIGQDITAIGYPATSLITIAKGLGYFENKVVLPMVTFGRIAMYHTLVNNYYGDITVYPGNSGGPVISNNKMVGLVNAQIMSPVSLELNSKYFPSLFASRGNLAQIQKTKYILRMLRELQSKEKH